MPAHLRSITVPTCAMCQRFATCTLYDQHNGKIADYCDHHGQKALAAFLDRQATAPEVEVKRPTWVDRQYGDGATDAFHTIEQPR